ncbi:exported hypothetical protein [Candidatus Sulfopaludibacter sp. SbA4]|nr:exported hypothetical protein [Candidatus Sulfopaludibacter sp. SbA4]
MRCAPWKRCPSVARPALCGAALRAPCIAAERLVNDDDDAVPDRFQLPVPADRAELTLPDLVIAFREAIDAAPYREAS